MKKLLVMLMALLLVVVTSAFTWEGELNPNNFDSWSLTNVFPLPSGLTFIIIQNPNEMSGIRKVALVVDQYSNLLGYRYFKQAEPYLYIFDLEEEKYKRKILTKEEGDACMKCHLDKLKVNTIKL